jgi:hypothetical protein
MGGLYRKKKTQKAHIEKDTTTAQTQYHVIIITIIYSVVVLDMQQQYSTVCVAYIS